MTWTFDHVSLNASGQQEIARFFGDVLGWQPGYRPDFGFDGQWLYNGEQAAVHLLARPGTTPHVTFAHLAFRTDEAAEAVIERVRDSGYRWQAGRHPDKPAAQIFVELPGGVVLELEAPLTTPTGSPNEPTK
ncbi:catechol 2,3-dioxygenase-like lactoylglutathione lyase family enzyme [Silvimonas terrae]|uniref:Catechol 2,3-dioxygenase-like lactoylglutathione lyase family enzyme n=1 Tax=Silvimonas terrae TaxID=300266 RepID=A0A840RK01_9NEIS|nr:VOC family protein [Silvimonas terrae]MBB5192848.1 catechol 2,3-dioxygenase-like lactoylglutathione lyase family enzyme [Silvimonas terrae]